MPKAALETPVGRLTVTEADGRIARVAWGAAAATGESPLLAEALAQLEAYFAGRLRAFDLPLVPLDDPFAEAVRAAMRAIPYGGTRTYGEIARDLGTYGKPVGEACAANPVPVIVPCHRVLATGGLGGYSGRGGVETKIALLRHEGGYPYLL